MTRTVHAPIKPSAAASAARAARWLGPPLGRQGWVPPMEAATASEPMGEGPATPALDLGAVEPAGFELAQVPSEAIPAAPAAAVPLDPTGLEPGFRHDEWWTGQGSCRPNVCCNASFKFSIDRTCLRLATQHQRFRYRHIQMELMRTTTPERRVAWRCCRLSPEVVAIAPMPKRRRASVASSPIRRAPDRRLTSQQSANTFPTAAYGFPASARLSKRRTSTPPPLTM
jgi:hypothetical protein